MNIEVDNQSIGINGQEVAKANVLTVNGKPMTKTFFSSIPVLDTPQGGINFNILGNVSIREGSSNISYTLITKDGILYKRPRYKTFDIMLAGIYSILNDVIENEKIIVAKEIINRINKPKMLNNVFRASVGMRESQLDGTYYYNDITYIRDEVHMGEEFTGNNYKKYMKVIIDKLNDNEFKTAYDYGNIDFVVRIRINKESFKKKLEIGKYTIGEWYINTLGLNDVHFTKNIRNAIIDIGGTELSVECDGVSEVDYNRIKKYADLYNTTLTDEVILAQLKEAEKRIDRVIFFWDKANKPLIVGRQ